MRRFSTRYLIWILVILICAVLSFDYIGKLRKSDQIYQPVRNHSNSSREMDILLEKLFNSDNSLDDVQLSWNRLIRIWREILLKFVRDACRLCHENDLQCSQSVDIDRYVYHLNYSFYPIDDSRRPVGMGLYYGFDFKRLRSLNDSILSSNATPCDYFHMCQLMIFTQIVLHERRIRYFITKGTFIGALRHHDLIPWDTDMDIFISQKDVLTFKQSFTELNPNPLIVNNTDDEIHDGPLHREDLVVYQFRNTHRVTSYKIFSTRSSRVNKVYYRWPKIDVFPYRESRFYIYSFPRHTHNMGTMSFLAKGDVEPVQLRPLGPLLVPSPQNLHSSLKAMIKLGQSNVFTVCEGNTFLHRQNRVSNEVWRVPCQMLSTTYPFVRASYHSSTNICTEEVLFGVNKTQLSLVKYQCDEHLPRTLNGE